MQIVRLQFPFSLHPARIPNFRAAIVEQVGLGHYLFHGHDNSVVGETKYSNDYPMIRFTVHRGKASIVGMAEGADAILRHLIPVIPSTLIVAGQPCDTNGWRISSTNWEPKVLTTFEPLHLHQWLALNKLNYRCWKKKEGEENARLLLLERCLTGHLRALAENCGFDKISRERIVARITGLDKVKKIKWHGTQFIAFNLRAKANFNPQLGLGLGRCHSFGFGEICDQKAYRHFTLNRPSVRGLKQFERQAMVPV